jgi:hypothetical protein
VCSGHRDGDGSGTEGTSQHSGQSSRSQECLGCSPRSQREDEEDKEEEGSRAEDTVCGLSTALDPKRATSELSPRGVNREHICLSAGQGTKWTPASRSWFLTHTSASLEGAPAHEVGVPGFLRSKLVTRRGSSDPERGPSGQPGLRLLF